MITGLFFIYGLFFGSFFMALADRWSQEQSIIKPRSHCENCNHPLAFYEMIPVISYIFLRGKCRNCHKHISIVYPIIELLTGGLFAISYVLYGFSSNLIIMLALSSLLVIVYVSDFKYLVILDIPLIITAVIIFSTVLWAEGLTSALWHLLSGIIIFLVMLLIKIVGDKRFKRESLGGGDVKLSFLFGLTLNFYLGIVVLVVASLLTYPLAIYYVCKKNDAEIPFGPFLMTGLVIVYVYQTPLINLLQTLIF